MMNKGSNSKLANKGTESNDVSYFQFAKELDLPIYIKVDFGTFDKKLATLLKELRFEELPKEKHQTILDNLRKKAHSRLLILEEATPIVARQIDSALETDRYGSEGITPKEGYRVYRFKGQALLVYSFSSLVWQLGCFADFGAEGKDCSEARTVINRFLSWALSPLGIVGFWAMPVEEGMVVFRNAESKGEAVFIDVMNQTLITQDGIKKIKGRFNILKLDSTLRGRNIRMSSEELMGFLTSHSSFFDYSGLSMAVRQMIHELSKQAQGLVHPRENFKPRTDLSL